LSHFSLVNVSFLVLKALTKTNFQALNRIGYSLFKVYYDFYIFLLKKKQNLHGFVKFFGVQNLGNNFHPDISKKIPTISDWDL